MSLASELIHNPNEEPIGDHSEPGQHSLHERRAEFEPVVPVNHTDGTSSDLLAEESESDDSLSDNEDIPMISPSMVARFSIPNLHNNLPRDETLELLRRVDDDLRTQDPDSLRHPETLRLLQDLCYLFRAVPPSFALKNVVFNKDHVIGKGGEATLYRGRFVDQGSSRTVVVREVVMPPSEWNSPAGRKVIRLVHREAITHSQLDHPNILPFLGVFHKEAGSPPMMILPLMEHGSLQSLLSRSQTIDLEKFRRILIGTSRAVVYLHTRQPPILHGDLHPGNVLLDADGNPQLCDFGLSRIRHEITRTRTILREAGRLRFLAPELSGNWMGRFRTSPESDIFSLGMTFYNTWSGKIPFSGIRSDFKAAARYRKGHRPELGTVCVTLTQAQTRSLWELLGEMWTDKPNSRPSGYGVLLRLTQIFPDAPSPLAPSPPAWLHYSEKGYQPIARGAV
ncbi:kinase-like protein [Clavulina sp. PMI_390]|nr:kinase-like protein [Clavulina sp. PMI_390]